ncbi:flagellar M-ring protein FliF [Verrucomicrobium sp. GAS474]|uniref:flagellar basal-body MS-ring/collar protein FliF n=1 Tax=Verrucomicrobium sp. GAS474 TaxID=1882831 RepID=UPI000879B595|nr:flagellar basal-body MS-ring/collar protein FliF [Verrucomicrobium sp. GAS474]SDU25133.1 flagellar M-ring protein FliF [Verrucomicrobium sp. GAS474]
MNELFKNVQQVWTGIPANRRMPILIAAAVMIIALTTVIVYSANKPKMDVLFGGMQITEAAKVVDFLKQKKVPYELADQGRTVRVPSTEVDGLRLGLAESGIPRADDTAGGSGFELFDKPSFGMPDFMQKANYNRAIQGELARTIRHMDDVEQARVMIVTPEQRLFQKDQKEAKASVFLLLKSGRSLGPNQIKAIQFLVANSVEGLQPNHVSIVDSTGKSLVENDEGNSLGALSNTQLAAKKAYEDYLRQKVQVMLDQTLGMNQSSVQISADLNFDAVQQTSEQFDPKSQVISQETISNESTHSKTSGTDATVGSKTNTEQNQDTGKTSNESDATKESQANHYNMNRVVQSTSKAMGVPVRLTAAVFVNVRKTGTGAAQTVTPRTPQEIQKLTEMVQQAIGYTNTGDRKDMVSVNETEFTQMFEEVPMEPAKTVLGLKEEWLSYVSQGILILLAVLVLLYLRGMLKTSNGFENDTSGEFSSILNRYKKMADDALAEADEQRVAPSALSADELGKLIRDNPGNTSQAIKVWMMRN